MRFRTSRSHPRTFCFSAVWPRLIQKERSFKFTHKARDRLVWLSLPNFGDYDE